MELKGDGKAKVWLKSWRARTLSADRTGRTAFMAGWYLRQYGGRDAE